MTRRIITELIMLAGLLAGTMGLAAQELEKEFAAPSNEYKPWVYWWWLNGNASKEGITRDFEELRKHGIAGALLFDAGGGGTNVPKGPAFMSEGWRDLFRHSLREADRCGISISVNLCTGWNANGPWVTEDHALKQIVVDATTVVSGPGRVSVSLPPGALGYYRDVVTLATPIPDDRPEYKLVASSEAHYDLRPIKAVDCNEKTRWSSKGGNPGGPSPEKPEFLQFDFAAPWGAAGLRLKTSVGAPKDVEVQCSDDGATFRALQRQTTKVDSKNQCDATISFPATRAKHFRVLFLSTHAKGEVGIDEIALLSPTQAADPKFDWMKMDTKGVIDVTRFVDAKGKLEWDPPAVENSGVASAPAGRWRILRLGYSLLGWAPANPGSGPGGREIDPLSAEAMDLHFANTGAKLIADAGSLAGKTLQYFHIDSWEFPSPTWTPRMREEFQRLRGYDPLPFLPAMFGWTVNDAAATEKFLADFRLTVSDLVAANYYGRLSELTRRGGLKGTHSESGGPNQNWLDSLQCLGKEAVPMGEFWKRSAEPEGLILYSGWAIVKAAASAAHIYGKPLCQAEAFTALSENFSDDPWSMKDSGDTAFCEGLTRMVFHKWHTQIDPAAKPGNGWQHIGVDFSYNQTWWPMSDGWLRYLARCQYLLRQGLFVADFAYLQNEDIPNFMPSRYSLQPARPAGCDYDGMNAEVLLNRAAAKEGRLTLPDRMSYRYLVLPHQPGAKLYPATLQKINELAEAGVAVIGPRELASSVPKLRTGDLNALIRVDGLAPDIEFRNPSPAAARFDYIHRRDGDTDIYFVVPHLGPQGSNKIDFDSCANVVFRVQGKQPEFWDAVTGKIRDLPEWRVTEDGRIEVPMRLTPRQSAFVVFRKQLAVGSRQLAVKNFPTLNPVMELAGPWEVQFDPQWFYGQKSSAFAQGATADKEDRSQKSEEESKIVFDRLEDWSKRSEEAIKYFSGTAIYRKEFDCPLPTVHCPLYLDLGIVKNLARVKLNGKDLGVVWAAPWRVEIPTGLLKSMGNELAIEVANLWPNRLIGDGLLPKEKRRTVTNITTYEPVTEKASGWAEGVCKACAERNQTGKQTLLSSGLLGPVKVLVAE